MRKFYSILGLLLMCATSLFAQTNYTVTFTANVEMEKVQVKNLSSGKTKMLYSPDNVITLQKVKKQETPIASVDNPMFLQQTASNEVIVNMEKAGHLNLTLYSSNGSFIARYSNNVEAGQNAFQIGASSGVYMLVASANNQTASLKILLTQSTPPSIIEVLINKPEPLLKSIDDVITFDEGDTFEFTGYYNNQTDVKTVVITSDKTITFSFTTTTTITCSPIPGNSVIKSSFSVSPNNKVYFSQGNLRFWSRSFYFAEHQYDIIGESNMYGSDDDKKISSTIDLFCWGTSGWNSGANEYMPTSSRKNDEDYYPGGSSSNDLTGNYANADWGVYNKISNGGNQAGLWRTLTIDEWDYLLEKRNNASSKKGYAMVNGVHGLILLPDNWTLPEGLTFKSESSSPTYGASYSDNEYSSSEWRKMEANGAVFLPAGGYRYNGVFNTDRGYYWSASADGDEYAYYMGFKSNIAWADSFFNRRFGISVRLVCDAPMVTTWPATVTKHSAIISGNVTKDNGATITERGICWGTTNNPTITDNKIICGTGIGELFSVKLTDLPENTTYYARAYAVNSAGISYGEIITFTTKYLENGTIRAAFSTGSNTQIYFSQGNLQYQASTGTWRFADQWEIVGQDNNNISSNYEGWIDLFGWGTSGYNGKNPYMTSSNYSDYGDGSNNITSTNYDWGVYNKISNGGNQVEMWRTLTRGEWEYLINKRTDASNKKGYATVNHVSGLVLLPDNWTLPADVTFTSERLLQERNTYSIEDWAKMEANGAVFLPAAGYRSGTDVNGVGSGYYWSSSANTVHDAYYLYFNGNGTQQTNNEGNYYGRRYGRSVRLVRDVK